MDQIENQIIIWYVSPYWRDTWHNIDVTRGMNNFQKKIQKIQKKIQKKLKFFKKNLKKCGADTWHIFNTVNSILMDLIITHFQKYGPNWD